MEETTTNSLGSAEKRNGERFWRLWEEGVQVLETHDGSIQEAVRMAWQLHLGLIEMREVPEEFYEEFVQLRKDYVDFRLSTAEFSVPDTFITEAAARKNADSVLSVFRAYRARDPQDS